MKVILAIIFIMLVNLHVVNSSDSTGISFWTVTVESEDGKKRATVDFWFQRYYCAPGHSVKDRESKCLKSNLPEEYLCKQMQRYYAEMYPKQKFHCENWSKSPVKELK